MSEEIFETNNYVGEDGSENKNNDSYNRPRYQKNGGGYNQRFSSDRYGQRGGYAPRGTYGDRQPRGNRPAYSSGYGEGRDGYQTGGYRQRYDENADYRGRGYQQTPRYGRQQGYSGGNDYRGQRYNNRNDYPRYGGGYGGDNADYQGADGSRDFRGRQQSRDGRPRHKSNVRPKFNFKKRIDYKDDNIDLNAPVRLNKFLANAGICSRRDADKYIQSGVITVNGNVVTELGTKVYRSDDIKFHDTPVRLEKKVYVLLNKPKGYVTTSEDPQNRKTVMDLVKNACPERIYPVGRLDRNTTGVLLLTNDGELASKLTHPKYLKKKIYHVFLDKSLTASDMYRISEGIMLDDGEIKADHIEYASATDKKQVGIEIHSGKNRIVRRIFESLGYHVTKLDRVYFAGLTKKNVRRGDWRYLTEKEVNMLRMGAFE